LTIVGKLLYIDGARRIRYVSTSQKASGYEYLQIVENKWIGQRMADLGRRRQILCVTHLAQVACFASNHFHVSKEAAGGRTSVRVERLDGARRLETVAQLLGGRAATEASRKHAQELLESSTP